MGGEINAGFRQLQIRADPRLVKVGDLFRQAFRLNRFSAFEGDRAFDGMFKFADVAGPGVRFEQPHGGGADRNSAARLRAVLSDEMFGELGNV